MSSRAFGVTLRVDPSGRRIVRLSGIALLLIGSALILHFPLATTWRILLLVIWAGDCGLCHWRLERGYGQVASISLDSEGGLVLGGPDGVVVPSALASGSWVGRRFAWLRFALPGAGRHAELVLANHSRRLDWHRFQLIWKLCRDTFGHRRRA